MLQGISVFLKQKNNVIAGRNIELLVADTGGNPAGTRTKASELIDRDKVDIVLGPLAAFEVLAITSFIREKEVPLITLAAAEDVTAAPSQSLVCADVCELRSNTTCDGRLLRERAQVQADGYSR